MIHCCDDWSITVLSAEFPLQLRGTFSSPSMLSWPRDAPLPESPVALVLIGDDGEHIAMHAIITDCCRPCEPRCLRSMEIGDVPYEYEWRSQGDFSPHPRGITARYGRKCCVLAADTS